jgi:hypothetical protein
MANGPVECISPPWLQVISTGSPEYADPGNVVEQRDSGEMLPHETKLPVAGTSNLTAETNIEVRFSITTPEISMDG